MIGKKEFVQGVIVIIVVLLLALYIAAECVIGHIEKHSTHEKYGNTIEAADNQFTNRSSLIKRVVFKCSPWDSC